jgi:hypothetical protein
MSTIQPAVSPQPRTEVQFGDLIIRFTSSFALCWDSKGSDSKYKGAFYHPIPPEGFYALSSIGRSNYQNPDRVVGALCVRPASEFMRGTAKPALKPPVDYSFIWNDDDSGADLDGSCWRPVPPEGYVALGDVFVRNRSKPPLDPPLIMCVAKELVHEGQVGDLIYDDRDSGAKRDFSSWRIGVDAGYHEFTDGLMAVNSFIGLPWYTKPATGPVVWTLRLPVPTEESGEPPLPQLDSKATPPSHTTPALDRKVTVPFTAVADPEKSTEWMLANSPFYEVERWVYYDLLIFDNNETSVAQTKSKTFTSGITREESQTFSMNTGITMTYEAGIEAGVFSTKTSLQLSLQLGYSQTTSVGVFEEQTQTAYLETPPQTAAALWLIANQIRVIRGDGTPVGPSLPFNQSDANYIERQFPPPSAEVQRACHRRERFKRR